MIADVPAFLDALAKFMVAQAAAFTPAVAIQYAGTPRSLWIHQAVEGADCADPYSVLRAYDAAVPWVPVIGCPVQCATRGLSTAATAGRAAALFNTMFDPTRKQVWRMKDIGNGFRLTGVDLRGLGQIGVDEKGRPQWVFNMDLRFVALT